MHYPKINNPLPIHQHLQIKAFLGANKTVFTYFPSLLINHYLRKYKNMKIKNHIRFLKKEDRIMSNSCNVKKSKSTSSKHNCFPCYWVASMGKKSWLELSRLNEYLIIVGKCGAIPSWGNGEGGGGGGGRGLLVNSKLGWSAVTFWLVTLITGAIWWWDQ